MAMTLKFVLKRGEENAASRQTVSFHCGKRVSTLGSTSHFFKFDDHQGASRDDKWMRGKTTKTTTAILQYKHRPCCCSNFRRGWRYTFFGGEDFRSLTNASLPLWPCHLQPQCVAVPLSNGPWSRSFTFSVVRQEPYGTVPFVVAGYCILLCVVNFKKISLVSPLSRSYNRTQAKEERPGDGRRGAFQIPGCKMSNWGSLQ